MTSELDRQAVQQVALMIGRQAIDLAEVTVENADLKRRLAAAEAEAAQLRAELLHSPTTKEAPDGHARQEGSAPDAHDQRRPRPRHATVTDDGP